MESHIKLQLQSHFTRLVSYCNQTAWERPIDDSQLCWCLSLDECVHS
jgi:hypothetical protein